MVVAQECCGGMWSVVGFPHVAVVEGGVLLGFTVLLWLKEECCWVSPRAVVEGGVDVHPDVWSNNITCLSGVPLSYRCCHTSCHTTKGTDPDDPTLQVCTVGQQTKCGEILCTVLARSAT